jgi:hypothetical protein
MVKDGTLRRDRMKIALVTVTHDPSGRNMSLFQELQAELEALYSELFITISEETSQYLVDLIDKSKFQTKMIPKLGVAHARREAVAFGLSGTSQHFHYCDFDRLLAWAKKHLSELKNVVSKIPQHDYLVIGRTERALNTHPIHWVETEKITNKICSLELGKEVDIAAGTCSYSRVSGNYIKKYSKEKMTDAEWAMIVQRIAKLNVDYIPLDGLEYDEAINGLNRKVSESEAWLSRLRLSLIISETACNTGK